MCGSHGAGPPLEDVRPDDDRREVAVGRHDGVVGKRQEVDRRGLEAPADVLLAAAGVDERALDRGSRFVLGVENARDGVRSFESPVEAAVLAVEGDLKLLDQELLDEVRTFAGDESDGLGGADPVAGALDVRGERLGRVARGTGHDASLGVESVGLARLLGAGDDRDRGAVPRGGESRRAPGHTRAEDEDIRRLGGHPCESSSETSAARTECVRDPTETASTPASA